MLEEEVRVFFFGTFSPIVDNVDIRWRLRLNPWAACLLSRGGARIWAANVCNHVFPLARPDAQSIAITR